MVVSWCTRMEMRERLARKETVTLKSGKTTFNLGECQQKTSFTGEQGTRKEKPGSDSNAYRKAFFLLFCML